MSVNFSPAAGFAAQFFDNNGVILSGGKIFTYAAGTTTPQTTYTNSSGNTAHTNPIILDSAGRVPGGEIWLTNGAEYKFVIETATGILIGTYDDITGTLNSEQVNFLQAGTNAVERTAQAKMRDTVSVKDFGAVGNGVADDTAAIQAAFNSLDPVLGGNLLFPPGRYRITATINLPITTSGTGRYEISGYGASVETSEDIVMFLRTVANNATALNVIGDRFTIAGLSLSGVSPPLPNSWGFKFGASYTSVFKDLNFLLLNTGLDLLFSLNTIVDGCMATLCGQYGFRARNGDWVGVTSSNSQSNVTAFRNCRVYSRTGAIAGYNIEGASGVTLHNCISEGLTQQYGVLYDSQLATVAKQLYIYNLHTEGSFTSAAVRLRGGGGQHIVDGWFHQGSMFGVPLLDTTGGNSNSEYIIQNSPSPTDTTNLIKCDANARFLFVNLQWGRMYLPAKWIGGVLPQFLNEQRIADPATEGGGNLYYAKSLVLDGDNVILKSNGNLTLRGQPNATFTDLLQVATTGGDVTRYISLRNIAGTETHYVPVYASLPNSSDFLAPSASAANIASITNAINTTQKYRGKQVFDTTNNRVMVATGPTAGARWYIVDGSAFVTPA